jgi:hypothetical protein
MQDKKEVSFFDKLEHVAKQMFPRLKITMIERKNKIIHNLIFRNKHKAYSVNYSDLDNSSVTSIDNFIDKMLLPKLPSPLKESIENIESLQEKISFIFITLNN